MRIIATTLGCLCATALVLSGCGKDSENQQIAASQSASAVPTATASEPAPLVPPAPAQVAPPPPSHDYAMVDNGTYGYEPALSEEDVRNGKATKPLIMMRYVGNKNGAYVIIILGQDASDTGVITRVSCQAPCQFAKSETLSGDSVIKTETLRVTPDSIVGAMLSDAVSGQLKPYGQTAAFNQITPPPVGAPTPAPATVQTSASNVLAAEPPSSSDTPLQQTSFDCNNAASIPQYLICHDADLAASDRSLADLVQKARSATQDQAGFSDRIRKQWNYREKTCKDKACLASWYAYESDVMTKIAQTGDVNAK